MNPGSADEALNSLINVDNGWIQQIYAAETKPPETGRSSSEMEMDVINIMNTAIKISRRVASTGIDTGPMGVCCGLGLATKSELEMQPVADSMVNRAHATPVTITTVPRSSCNLLISNVSESANTSALHKFSSAFASGQRVVDAARDLYRGAGVVKVKKKKRVRPSRRVPTTMVKTDTSNFKAMVEKFTGISATGTIIQESTAAPSAASSTSQSTSSATFPFLTKPLPHPVLYKLSNFTNAPAPSSAHPKE